MTDRCVKITKIQIEEFRRFNDVEFELGALITLIAGQNGTSKSTLLGMIAQPFSFGVFAGKSAGREDASKYTDNYHGVDLSSFKDLHGKAFQYDCKDVFRLSKIHDTDTEKYRYRLKLKSNCISKESPVYSDGLLVRAQKRPKTTQIRFVAGPGISSEKGEGNFPHPVIYLSLNRHWPLALAKTVEAEKTFVLSNEEKTWYLSKYKQILVADEEVENIEFVRADINKKGYIGVSGHDYDTESFSAGQDSLAQILTAILSFKRLKEKLKDRYQGGMILIDEIDSTLHSISQQRLLDELAAAAEQYSLQIVGTTHSLNLLEYVYKSKLNKKTKVIYLQRLDDIVDDAGFTSFAEIEGHLKVISAPPQKKATKLKVSVVFEDQVGKSFFDAILGNHLKQYIKPIKIPKSGKSIKNVSSSYLFNLAPLAEIVPELSKIILVPDGDMEEESRKSVKTPKNLICLPGTFMPERLLFDFLKSLSGRDPFWKKCKGFNYSKQTAITSYGSVPDEKQEAKKWYKTWYKKQSPYWGTNNVIAFKAWGENNKELSRQFCMSFLKILKKLSPEAISKETVDKILNQFK
ncbi:MAG: AAA family ATPase [Candidatus Riflebacteria bacterium]|nr:AAA family ATPase [Candidatus Riflebacteria bacterium]